jgi:hypothetical protein
MGINSLIDENSVHEHDMKVRIQTYIGNNLCQEDLHVQKWKHSIYEMFRQVQLVASAIDYLTVQGSKSGVDRQPPGGQVSV